MKLIKLIPIIVGVLIGIIIGFIIPNQPEEIYPKELLLKAEAQAEELRKFNTQVEVKKFIAGTYVIIFNLEKLSSIDMIEIEKIVSAYEKENSSIYFLRILK